MAQIKSEAAYRVATKRIDELLKVVSGSTPVDDPNYIELDMLSDMVAEYEDGVKSVNDNIDDNIKSQIKYCLKKCWPFFLLLFMVAIPFIINRLILIPSIWEYVGEPKDWLAFWPSYLCAAASAVMIAFTAISLKSNDKLLANNIEQLNELKRQWRQEHEPDVSATFFMFEKGGYIRIMNISKVEIRSLSIKIIEDPGISIKEQIYKYDIFKKDVESLCLDIEPNGVRNIIVSESLYYEINPNDFISLHFSYNSHYEKDVKIYFNRSYFIGNTNIEKKRIDQLENINKAIKAIKF